MYPHFNQYFKMTPEEVLEDDKRVRRNKIEGLLLVSIFGNLILPSQAQASAVDITKPNAEIECVILCTNSDSNDDSAKRSFFAEGFSPNYKRS